MNTIPGTNVPLAVYTPTGARPFLQNESEQAQRRGLLAMVHIAKKDLALNEGEYEMILRGFKVASSGELNIPQLERLVKYLKRLGWKPVRKRRRGHDVDGRGHDAASCPRCDARLDALRARCVEVAKSMENGEKRLAGLAAKICGFASLTWCRDAAKLERLLAVLGSIKEKETQDVVG
jgi:phage gp16-like protein